MYLERKTSYSNFLLVSLRILACRFASAASLSSQFLPFSWSSALRFSRLSRILTILPKLFRHLYNGQRIANALFSHLPLSHTSPHPPPHTSHRSQATIQQSSPTSPYPDSPFINLPIPDPLASISLFQNQHLLAMVHD